MNQRKEKKVIIDKKWTRPFGKIKAQKTEKAEATCTCICPTEDTFPTHIILPGLKTHIYGLLFFSKTLLPPYYNTLTIVILHPGLADVVSWNLRPRTGNFPLMYHKNQEQASFQMEFLHCNPHLSSFFFSSGSQFQQREVLVSSGEQQGVWRKSNTTWLKVQNKEKQSQDMKPNVSLPSFFQLLLPGFPLGLLSLCIRQTCSSLRQHFKLIYNSTDKQSYKFALRRWE